MKASLQSDAFRLHIAALQHEGRTEPLDQILAPFALFPDEVLSNVLMTSTYPLEVVQAARWRKGIEQRQALSKALEPKEPEKAVACSTRSLMVGLGR